MPEVSMKSLLEAGAHFGHQTKRWNPKMRKYIFGSRNGIYIIDLQKTQKKFNEAVKFITNEVANGKNILFVGTKKQASEIIGEEAQRCGMFHITRRWLGGTLTNWATINKSISRLKELESMKESGVFSVLPKKEVVMLDKEMVKLNKFFGGIKNMGGIPSIIFIVDTKKEKIALTEARRVGAKTVAVVDTNCDPEGIDYVIPSNDDAIRAIKLVVSQVAEAVLDGKKLLEMKTKAKKEEDDKRRAEAQKSEKVKEKKQAKDSEKKQAAKSSETDKKAPAVKAAQPDKTVKKKSPIKSDKDARGDNNGN